MSGEDAGLPYNGLGFFKGFALFKEGTDAFQGEEGGMPLIHLVNVGFVPKAFQSAFTTDAKQDFLGNAHFEVADIEFIGELAVLGVVLRDICLQ